MKRLVLSLLCVLVVCPGLVAQDRFVHADGKYLVDPDGQRLMLRGTNLGNWLVPEGYMFGFQDGPQSDREIEALLNELVGPVESATFWRRYQDTYVTEEDIRLLKNAGFNSIRLPFHYKYFVDGNSRGFELADRVVEWAKKYGLYVVLDMHCAPGGQTGTNIDDSWGYPWLFESPEEQELTVHVWRRIAEHYHDNPTILGYDLLNEPIPHFPQLQQYNPALEPLYKRITASVREVDKNHVVILGGAQWDSNFKVFGPPFDKNVMYTFHKYWTAPTEEVIREYIDYRDKYNVPIWLGESGENTDQWIQSFIAVLEKDEIGWAFWPYKKLESKSGVVACEKPVYWDEIVKYAKTPHSTGTVEKHLAERPPIAHCREALNDLLQKVQRSHCRVNDGYLKALGMKSAVQ